MKPKYIYADPLPRLEISYRSIDSLTLDPRNPRRHDRRQLRKLARNVQIFGFNVPVGIDKSGKVLFGHGRILACKLLGIKEVPTVCLQHLTPTQAQAFMIADNRLTELATGDKKLLGEIFLSLTQVELDLPQQAPWLTDYVIELISFPRGKHSDQVDSTSQALTWIKSATWGPGMGIFNYYKQEMEKKLRSR